MKVVIGLGNPGPVYDETRHNIGFQVIEQLKRKKPKGVKLVKPRTYVNQSGSAAAAIVEELKATTEDILVVCDDVNLRFGKVRLREAGSSGGHHGLEDIIQQFGSEKFPRLRIGIGVENMPRDLTGFVLGKFSAKEKKELDGILEKAALVCQNWAEGGFQAALNCLSRLQSSV